MTPATRQQHRRAQFAAAIVAAGWKSDSEFVTAVINHLVKVPEPTIGALLRRSTNAPSQRRGVGHPRSGEKEKGK